MQTMKYSICWTLLIWFVLFVVVFGQEGLTDTKDQDGSTHPTYSPMNKQITRCWGEKVDAKCSTDKTLTWIFAEYKTLDDSPICERGNTIMGPDDATGSPLKCSRDRINFLENHCGCNNCNFLVNDTFLYGSPCSKIYNYVLDVTYKCEGRSGGRNHHTGTLSAEIDYKGKHLNCNPYTIAIESATFRTMEAGTGCSKDVSSVVSDMCDEEDDSNFCTIEGSTLLKDFGDPCADKFYTYLELEYLCNDNPCSDNEGNEVSVTEENVEEVVDSLVTDIEESIKQEEDVDITAVKEVLDSIIDVGSPSPNVTESVVKVVSAILSSDVSSANEESAEALSEILKSVEKQVENTLEKHGKFSSVQPNIAVEGVTVDETQDGVGFAININEKGFDERSSRNFDPSMQSEDETGGHSIQLPKGALFKTENTDSSNGTKVSFIAYNDSKLFPSDGKVPGPVISATVLGKDKIVNLDEPVVIKIEPRQVGGDDSSTLKCVYWDFSKRDWAEDGCELISAESGMITCQCNHLTNFAVLVDFSGEALSFTLDIISKVGCVVSILALCLTLMIFLCCRGLRLSLQRKILVQLCISMLGLYVAFLIGIDSTDSEIGCLAVAALLHYFVVTTMLWMGVEARHMYITLVSESARVSRKFMIRASIFAWGVGLIPVGVLLGIKQLDYRASEYCFLALDEGLFYGLLLPIGLVILHNIITFCLVARKLLSSRSYVMKTDLENLENESGEVEYFEKTGVRDISQRLLNAFAVSILLGITWVFGFLAVEEAREVFQLLFCICNSFQGFFIFILFCVGQKDVRKLVCAKCVPDAPSHQPKVQKVQHKKPSAVGVTSISSDTRVTGESYSEDNDTLATTI